MAYTKEQLEGYIKRMEERLAQTGSKMMKAEIRKAIKVAKAELAKF